MMKGIIELINAWGARFTDFAQSMLVQSAALVTLLLAADFVLRKRARAGLRYALWVLVLVKLVLPPTLTLPTSIAHWLPKEAPAATASFLMEEAAAPVPGAVVAASLPQPSAHQEPVTWPGILLLVWIGVAAALAARVAWHFRGAHRLVRETTAPPASALELLEECRERLGLPHLVHLRAAPGTVSPAVFGVFRPVVVISSELLEKLSGSELRSILLHELAHVKRGDLWINHLQILLQVLYWYNPAVWLANAMIRRAREQAVDETVLVELKDEAETYPSTLVQVAKLALRRPAMRMGFVGILEQGSSLNQRIRHMLNHPAPKTARLGIFGALLVGLVAIVALPMGRTTVAAEKTPEETADINFWVSRGTRLTAAQATELEAKLRENPQDAATRRLLLGYYKGSEARRKHILWFIEHQPESVLNRHFVRLHHEIDDDAFHKGKELWLKHVKDKPKNVEILGNAANYLLYSDGERAEELLLRAKEIQPESSEWPGQLAKLYQLKGRYAEPGTKEELMKKALSEMKAAQAMTTEEMARFYNLDYLSSMAFSAGELEQAKEYAEKLLQQAKVYSKDWASGNAVHNGNIILGRIALRKGNVAEAAKHLQAAGKSRGLPQLNRFAPSLILAKELLEKGQNEAVLEYLDSVGSFWQPRAEQLEDWKELIRAGRIPDFGTNFR